jgi:hypothetical protein
VAVFVVMAKVVRDILDLRNPNIDRFRDDGPPRAVNLSAVRDVLEVGRQAGAKEASAYLHGQLKDVAKIRKAREFLSGWCQQNNGDWVSFRLARLFDPEGRSSEYECIVKKRDRSRPKARRRVMPDSRVGRFIEEQLNQGKQMKAAISLARKEFDLGDTEVRSRWDQYRAFWGLPKAMEIKKNKSKNKKST